MADGGFHAAMTGAVARLPWGLDDVVAPTLVGYAVINGSTFALDLALLTLLHGQLSVALPVAFTIAYVTAFACSFVLNRRLNFESRAPVGSQVVLYAIAVAINYLAFILAVADGLSALGVEYHVARVVAAVCEAIYMYCVLRWIVFRDRGDLRSTDQTFYKTQ